MELVETDTRVTFRLFVVENEDTRQVRLPFQKNKQSYSRLILNTCKVNYAILVTSRPIASVFTHDN